MAGSPKLKIFNPCGDYVGSMKHGEDAAMVVAGYGDGAQVRYGHTAKGIIWREGQEEFSAGESYDRCAEVLNARIAALYAKGA